MTDFRKEVEYWHDKVNDLTTSIYQVKDNALGNQFGEAAKWHAALSNVTAELRLLSAWLGRVARDFETC